MISGNNFKDGNPKCLINTHLFLLFLLFLLDSYNQLVI
jgi:hypothetical protein